MTPTANMEMLKIVATLAIAWLHFVSNKIIKPAVANRHAAIAKIIKLKRFINIFSFRYFLFPYLLFLRMLILGNHGM